MSNVMEALPKDTSTLEWEAMARAFEEAVQHSDPYRALTPPSPRPAVMMLLRLLEAQQVDAATRLARALTEWLDQNQGEGKLGTGLEAAAWVWLKQLLPLRERLPPAVVAAIAHGLLVGDLGRARPFLDAEYRIARASTLEALGVLHAEAPEIEVMVDPFRYETVSPAEAAGVVHSDREGGGRRALWIALKVFIGFLITSGLLVRIFFN